MYAVMFSRYQKVRRAEVARLVPSGGNILAMFYPPLK